LRHLDASLHQLPEIGALYAQQLDLRELTCAESLQKQSDPCYLLAVSDEPF